MTGFFGAATAVLSQQAAPAGDKIILEDLWDPSNYGTVSGHWDAADTSTMTLSGTDLLRWEDKSGSGNHFVQTVDLADAPTVSGSRQFNGVNVVDTDGTQWMKTAGNVNMQNATDGTFTVMVVFELDATSGSDYLILNQDSESGTRLPQFFRTYLTNAESIIFNTSPRTESQPVSTATTYVASVVGNRDSLQIWLNDTSNGATTFTAADINHAGDNELYLFSRANPAAEGLAGIDGAVAEIVIWSEALSTADREAAQDELNDKWGFTTPTDEFVLLETGDFLLKE